MRSTVGIAIAAVLGCSACTNGASVEGVPGSAKSALIQGGLISYDLPKAIWTFVATYDPKSKTPFAPIPHVPVVVQQGSDTSAPKATDATKGADTTKSPDTTSQKSPNAVVGDTGTTGLFTLVSTTGAPIVVPDAEHPHYLSYTHADLSDDIVDIQWNGLMIKKVSSDTTDQSVKTLEALNSLISEVTAARSALVPASNNAQIAKFIGPAAKVASPRPPSSVCPDGLSSYTVVNASDGSYKPASQVPTTPGTCFIDIQVIVKAEGPDPLFVSSQTAMLAADAKCDDLICFPLTRVVDVQVSAALFKTIADGNSKANCSLAQRPDYHEESNDPFKVVKDVVFVCDATGKVPLSLEKDYQVTVPWSDTKGYVRFDRRAFVDNKTSISFDSNGGVSEFSSTDPSAVAGTLTLATDALKSVVLTVPLVR